MARIAHVLGNEWRSADIQTEEDRTFNSFLLSENVLHGLKSAGFVKPSPIQYQAIPLGRSGLDLIVQSKSGTGKTCVFAVIALEKLLLQSKATQALVLAPTREVAVQICQVVTGLGCGFKGLQCHVFIGGIPVSEDKAKLKHCHIAIGTPGRIKQLIKDGLLMTSSIRLFVLDEADKLLEEGFQETINWIYSSLPIRKQMLALSATYPEKLAELLELYMTSPALVRLNADKPALLGVRQFYRPTLYNSMALICFQAKVQALLKILKTVQFSQCIVFSNYQTRAESLCDVLKKHNWPTDYISGSQEQSKRLQAIDKLKQFKCRVMVSTDVTSRGIDAENVNLVVNMDVPWEVETYLHRIGRAGRFGTRGLAVTFVTGEEETTQFKEIVKKGELQVYALPDPLPPNLWTYASFVEENSVPSLLDTENMLSKNSCEGSNLSNEQLQDKENICKDFDVQNVTMCAKEKRLSSDSCLQVKSDVLNVTQNKEQPVNNCDKFLKNFDKSFQQPVNMSDTVQENTEELDEETKLLMSLNSFLVSNREEFHQKLRVELEDELERCESGVVSAAKEQAERYENDNKESTDNVCEVTHSSLDNSKTDNNSNLNVTLNTPQSNNVGKFLNFINSMGLPQTDSIQSPPIIFHDYLEDNKPTEENACQKSEIVESTPNDELDEEMKLLLSLNSFLVSNHEEYRLKLETEFEKYDSACSATTTIKQTSETNSNSSCSNKVSSVTKSDKKLQTQITSDQIENSIMYPEGKSKDTCRTSSNSLDDEFCEEQLEQNNEDNGSSGEDSDCSNNSESSVNLNYVKFGNESAAKLEKQNGSVLRGNENNFENPDMVGFGKNDTVLCDTVKESFMTNIKATGGSKKLGSDKRNNNRGTKNGHVTKLRNNSAGICASSSFSTTDVNGKLHFKHRKSSDSTLSDDSELSSESDLSSIEHPSFSKFNRLPQNPENIPNGVMHSNPKSRYSNVHCTAHDADYELQLRRWWKPNTRMAVKYLEYQNFMSNLIRSSKDC